ncbi:MAG TPA: ABC transporter ATP-binding protein [Myxococcales bacterium]|jgi:ABC-2 type transport system ATP-binding protein|nr:ABC transporter ATP-binding protein [Myxococcales bacterium]
MTAALSAQGLTKRYWTASGGAFLAVDNFSLEVQPGEIIGLLGPNGAGKTTAMQLALGLLHPDAGIARLFGLDPEDLTARRQVGYAPDAPLFPKVLTGKQVLELHCDLLGADRSRVPQLIEQLNFVEASRRPTATYSRGQQQRLGFAQALLGEPALLLLDEPTAGLDPAGVAQVREILVGVKSRGGAVLLNSHLLSEVERVCDRVLFVKGGKLLRTHEVGAGGKRAELRLANAAQVALEIAAKLPAGVLEGDRLRVPVPDESAVPKLVREVVALGGEILEVKLAGAELEELYLRLVEGQA